MAKGKRVSTVPADETKEQKSVRLARARMTVALAKITLVGNLSGRTYSFTPEQIAAMIDTLRNRVAAVEHMFKPSEAGAKDKDQFSF